MSTGSELCNRTTAGSVSAMTTTLASAAAILATFTDRVGRGPNSYPIKFWVTTGDYRQETPEIVHEGRDLAEAVAAYERHTPERFPQLFAIEADYDGEHRDSKRLTPDWTRPVTAREEITAWALATGWTVRTHDLVPRNVEYFTHEATGLRLGFAWTADGRLAWIDRRERIADGTWVGVEFVAGRGKREHALTILRNVQAIGA